MAANPNGVLDMSLDDIIEKSKSHRGRRGPGGAIRRSGRNDRSRPYGNSPRPSVAGGPLSDKIVVSNLAKSVSQNDVHELFSQIGPVRSAQLNYDAQGRSKGVATVIFTRPRDAQLAIREYHNRTLDNKPMKIELIVRADATSVSSTPGRLGGSGPRSARGGPSGGRRRGGDRRRGQDPMHKKAPKTQEELDAEMDAYMKDEAMEVDNQSTQLNPEGNGVNLNLANALNGTA